ncbi:energy-coupling factor ABC transporter ATP-binding protein [Martelella endophytica]|uniref:Cobalt ABC transporter ATP-binding protein n=1 Tax=Martelella endophytica TaxID=1486262 RepID=A0A0D5LPQ7_MAREN|nr:energy-coupling factor ABC transporter ATP-binding protein [Martelella endophytica]AJY46214.1 cobalt ABC transporter ATP-binding protein [Martelella endophytica]
MHIEFDQAGVAYDGRTALHRLSLTLTGRRIGVIGLNGSGKTTFARLINGLTKPSVGRVRVNGRDTVDDADGVLADTGYVFQAPQNQIILPIVEDDIALGLKARGVAKADIPVRAEEALSRLGISHLGKRRSHELSGGELQLAALAAVLATRPSLVILDEPTNQLDLKNRRRVAETIDALSEDVIAISHDLATLSRFERVLLFHEARLIADGPADAVIGEYEAMNR